MRIRIFLAALALPALAGAALAVTQLTRGVLGAGGLGAQGITTRVISTLGQPVVASGGGTVHQVRSGFWNEAPPAVSSAGDLSDIPSAYLLHPGSPNPLVETCALRYDVPAGGGHVVLCVYDVQGRRLRTILDAAQAAGRHVATWNGRDEQERRVAPGVYFAVFEAPGYTRTRKLVVAH